VLDNLGYCYVQLARQEMEVERAYFYWLPLLLDGETRAQALVRRGGPHLKPSNKRPLARPKAL
jgi:hypothetical protein